jgi:hypothetical protein
MTTTLATRKCHEWLRYCLEIGWPRESLKALADLWWKYHDKDTGRLTVDTEAKP